MKKTFAIILSSLACLVAMAFNTNVAVSIVGNTPEGQIKVSPENTEESQPLKNSWWLKDEGKRAYELRTSPDILLTSEWTAYKLVWKQDKAGMIRLNFAHGWNSKKNDASYVMVTNIKCNGKLIPNGNLMEFYQKGGKCIPHGCWISADVRYRQNAGPNGEGVVEFNHKGNFRLSLKIENNGPVELEFMAKKLSDDQASSEE